VISKLIEKSHVLIRNTCQFKSGLSVAFEWSTDATADWLVLLTDFLKMHSTGVSAVI